VVSIGFGGKSGRGGTSSGPDSYSSVADLEAQLELELYREYRGLVGAFRFSIETERRFYLANSVKLETFNQRSDVYFELRLEDAWVWDIFRSNRFMKRVHVLTFRDVHVEELSDELRPAEKTHGRPRATE
jgi:hypothetical protein